jgi:hypothetical protein
MPPPGNPEACGQSGPGKVEMFRARKNRLAGLLCRPAIPAPREFASSRNATDKLVAADSNDNLNSATHG